MSSSSSGKRKGEGKSVESYARKLTTRIAEEELSLRERREQLEQDIEQFERVSKKLNNAQLPSPVTLNIGGMRFSASLDTLKKDRNSFFGAMFAGGFDPKPSADGSYFIDRDGTHFRYILNYLRDGSLVIPQGDRQFERELLIEAQFYQIQGILDILDAPEPLFEGSTIFNNNDISFMEQLNEWSGDRFDRKWKLIYQGSFDGYEATKFHSHCDDMGSTYIILESGGNIFGGYNQLPWSSPNTALWMPGESNFLFSLINPFGIPPIKLPIMHPAFSTVNFSRTGPIFGNGDLHVGDRCNEGNCKSIFSSYSNPTGEPCLFTGQQVFLLSEIEVFVRRQE